MTDDEIAQLPQCPPTPRGYERARALVKYDPIDDEITDNLHDIIETSVFPEQARLDNNPAARLVEQIALHGDLAAQKALDKYLLRFEMVGMKEDQIAKQLDLSVSMTRTLMRSLRDRMRRQTERLDVHDLLADSLGSLRVQREEGMKILFNDTVRPSTRLSAIEKLTNLEVAKFKILDVNKFYDRKGYTPNEDEDHEPTRNTNYMINMVQNIFNGAPIEEDKLFQDMQYSDDVINISVE